MVDKNFKKKVKLMEEAREKGITLDELLKLKKNG
jgi:hypothetical protein